MGPIRIGVLVGHATSLSCSVRNKTRFMNPSNLLCELRLRFRFCEATTPYTQLRRLCRIVKFKFKLQRRFPNSHSATNALLYPLVTMSSRYLCGFVSNSRGMSNHRRTCNMYKEALKRPSAPIVPRGPLDRRCFVQAPAPVTSHAIQPVQPVQEQPHPSLHIEEEEPLGYLTNATNDIQMVHTASFPRCLY